MKQQIIGGIILMVLGILTMSGAVILAVFFAESVAQWIGAVVIFIIGFGATMGGSEMV